MWQYKMALGVIASVEVQDDNQSIRPLLYVIWVPNAKRLGVSDSFKFRSANITLMP